ncbi:MAG: FAD-dependent oxidoreductase, partial [Oscillospiraceae bacterium]|nr:FAD-dependent oxidoreductase [Oscillospiraceae bacterium]
LGAAHRVTPEGVLMETGRRACRDGLLPDGSAPKLERGAVAADAEGRTSVPHLYVIGDARAGNVQLAHVAAAQGENVAALLSGREKPVDETLVPSCVYTSPEIASVGLSEEAAKAAGIAVKTGKCLTGTNGKCLIEDAAAGYVKLVAESESGRLLGAQLVCPRATDMIAELALAVQRGVTAAQLAAVIHPHPTFSEMICAAAAALAE